MSIDSIYGPGFQKGSIALAKLLKAAGKEPPEINSLVSGEKFDIRNSGSIILDGQKDIQRVNRQVSQEKTRNNIIKISR